MITNKTLLDSGYKEHEVNKMFHPYANRLFQKRFRNDYGDTKYFITFYEYYWEEKNEYTYNVDLQFEKDRYTMNIQLFALDEKMTVEEIEQEVYAIWYGLDCKYYEKGESNE